MQLIFIQFKFNINEHDYEFIFNDGTNKVNSSDAYKVIGNAVPPLLGYAIGKRLESLWNDLFGE